MQIKRLVGCPEARGNIREDGKGRAGKEDGAEKRKKKKWKQQGTGVCGRGGKEKEGIDNKSTELPEIRKTVLRQK